MGTPADILYWTTVALTAASTTYTYTEQRKMEKKARAAAEARKGFELVSEGSITSVPLVYGKALIGGVRVYHNTSSSFQYTSPNSDKVFLTGQTAAAGGTFTYQRDYDSNGDPITEEVTYAGYPSGTMSANISGNVNEFLAYQQVLCLGNINRAYEVIVDDLYIDNPLLGTVAGSTTLSDKKTTAALRADVHYQSRADNIFSTNFPGRRTAVFTQMAHADCYFRLDRDNPQFSNVPDAQFIIEGRLVRTVVSGAVVESRVYSNNPAWCLLDYLTDTTVGKGLTTDLIDLASFEAAAAICSRIVKSNAPVGGKLYKPTDGFRNVTTRDIPLYECNLVLDTTKPIRDNVQAILSTMGDARLVWVSGKYRLVLQYPESNAEIVVAQVITDADLIPEDNFEVVWPTIQDRYNHYTVKFHNETENFKEDTVSWPPKIARNEKRGTGGKYYNPVSEWATDRNAGSFLNSFAVWDGTSLTMTSLTYRIVPDTTGVHTLSYLFDDSGSIQIYNSSNTLIKTVTQSSFNRDMFPFTTTVSLNANEVYRIEMIGGNSYVTGANLRGAAATLVSTLGIEIWSTRSPAYDSIESVNVTDTLYQTFLTEDSGIDLEGELFAEGITDYYHALAKAEEIVRTSRTAAKFKFKYMIQNSGGTVRFLTPGDIIKFESESLSLGISSDLYIKVDSAKIVEGFVCEISGQRFDYTQLAWNVDDNEYLVPEKLYAFGIAPPEFVDFTVNDITNTIKNSSGTLSWPPVASSKLAGYIIYMNTAGQLDNDGRPLFVEIGRTSDTKFYLPQINAVSAYFGVRAYATDNIKSDMTITSSYVVFINKDLRRLSLMSSSIAFVQKANSNDYLNNTITLTARTENYLRPEYKFFREDLAEPLVQTGSSNILTVSAFSPGSARVYRVEVTDLAYPSESTLLIDRFSIYSVKEGSDVFNVVVSNEYILLNADSEGTLLSGMLPVTIQAESFKGIVKQTSGVVYSLTDATNVTASINSSTGLVTITAMPDISVAGSLRIIATRGSEVANKTVRIVKVLAGVTAPLLNLQASGPGFIFKNSSSVVSDSPDITVNAVLKGITGTVVFEAKAYNTAGELQEIMSISPVGNTLVITPEMFAAQGPQVQYVTVTATLGALTDVVTIYRGNDGADSVILVLSNESHTVASDSDGNPESLIGASTNMTVYQGVTVQTNLWSFAKTDYNVTSALDTSNPSLPSVAIVDFPDANDSGYVDITATRTGFPTQTKRFSLSKSKEGQAGAAGVGTPGINARSVDLSVSTQTIVYNTEGVNPSVASVSATAVARNTSGDVYYQFFRNGVSLGEPSLTPTVSVNTGTTYLNSTIKIEVQIREESAVSPVVASDIISLFGVRAGSDSLSVVLSNESHTIPAESDGTPLSFSGSGTTLDVFQGATKLTYDGIGSDFPAAGKFKVSRIQSAVTVGGSSGTNTTTAVFADISGMSSAAGTITYTIRLTTLDGVQRTLSKVQSFSKSIKGTTGATGVGIPGSTVKSSTGYLYYQLPSVSSPVTESVPTYNSDPYNFSTGVFNVTNTTYWRSTPPVFEGGNRYWYRTFSVTQTDGGSQVVSIGVLQQGTNFSGLVTFTSLSTGGLSSINGDNIQTGTLSADRLKAGAVGLASGYEFDIGVGSAMAGFEAVIITKGGNDDTDEIHGAIHVARGAANGLNAGFWGTGSGQAAYFARSNNSGFTDIVQEVGFCNGAYAINVSAGNVFVNGDIISSFSDGRLKTIVGRIDNALDKVKNINGYYYRPNEIALARGHESKTYVGCITQEVEKVMPEVIRDYDDKYKTMMYERMIPLLIEAIKELNDKVEALTNDPANKRSN